MGGRILRRSGYGPLNEWYKVEICTLENSSFDYVPYRSVEASTVRVIYPRMAVAILL